MEKRGEARGGRGVEGTGGEWRVSRLETVGRDAQKEKLIGEGVKVGEKKKRCQYAYVHLIQVFSWNVRSVYCLLTCMPALLIAFCLHHWNVV